MSTLYEDKYVTLDEAQLTIRHYYFPLGGKKTIAYSSIKKVYEIEMNFFFEGLRLWGGGWHGQWMHLDLSRPSKKKCIIIEADGSISAGVTPANHDAVLNLLLQRVGQTAA